MIVVRWMRNVDGWRRGDEVAVSRSPYIDKLVSQGMLMVVEDNEPQEPARNASRADWEAFLTSRGYEVHPQATRRDLIDMWDGVYPRG